MNRGELTISSFNRENCKTGIVHLGVGNFHRAHQANYIDEYLNTSNNMNWGICGINLRKEDSKNFENLKLRIGKYILNKLHTNIFKFWSFIYEVILYYPLNKGFSYHTTIFLQIKFFHYIRF